MQIKSFVTCDKLLIMNVKNKSLTERQRKIILGSLLMVGNTLANEIGDMLYSVTRKLGG